MRTAKSVLAATLAVVAVGCGGGQDGPSADGPTRTLNIHVSTNSPINADLIRATQMALEDAGGRAGRFKIRLIVHNEASPESEISDPGRVRRNAREAARDPQAIAYVGDASSASSAVSAPILNRAGVLQVSPSASYVGLTTRSEATLPGEPGKYRPSGRRTFARVIPADNLDARAGVLYARAVGITRLGLVADKTLIGRSLVKLVRSEARDLGLPAVDAGPGGSVTAQVSRVLAAGADGVYFAACGAPGELSDIMGEHRSLRAVAGNCYLFPPEFPLPSTLNGRFFVTSPGGSLGRTAAGRRWAERWRRRYGAEPRDRLAFPYEAMSAVLAAIERAGDRGDDRAAVIREFFATRKRDAIVGRYSIDRNGDSTLRNFGGYAVRDRLMVFDRVLDVGR